jgi:hypothetical protein
MVFKGPGAGALLGLSDPLKEGSAAVGGGGQTIACHYEGFVQWELGFSNEPSARLKNEGGKPPAAPTVHDVCCCGQSELPLSREKASVQAVGKQGMLRIANWAPLLQ